ncbi:Tryptophan synthase alpha chain [Folsomia candida]|uniref:Tryptophan synthase alpha chain n=2 Tax=Folsomia candida TaxID=158441 RepID=A0A226E9G5_FOLCA|nr:Tryptophan synthase alpha chain [Folsomia candida]
MSFLPTVDLLTCSTVNATWEGEARKHVRVRISIRLTGYAGYPKFEEYVTLMSVRGNYHERLHTCYRYFEEFQQFLSKLDKLASNSRGKIKHLFLPFIMQGGPEFRRFFEILHLFGHNLSALELSLCHHYHYTDTLVTTTIADMSPFLTGLSSRPPLPSITKLSICSWSVAKNATGLTVAKLGPLFPNVSTLEYFDPDRNAIEMQLIANPFPRLSALRIMDIEYTAP